MSPRLIPLLLATLALSSPALAAERSYVVTNFDRVRVDGPFEVRLTVGGAGTSSGRAEGEDRALDTVDISVQGSTLIVRRNNSGWGEQGRPGGPAPIITIATPMLRSATVIGGGRLSIAGPLRAQRLDLQVTGAGVIDARDADADELYATLIGTGNIRAAGSARRARLATSGTGGIDAEGLVANDLTVRLDGPGETRANARYTADLTSTGLGRVTVKGGAKCVKHAQAGGPIVCDSDGGPQ